MDYVAPGVYTMKNLLLCDDVDKYRKKIDDLRMSESRCFASGANFYNGTVKYEYATWDIWTRIKIRLEQEEKAWLPRKPGRAAPYVTFAYYASGQGFGIHTDTGILDPSRKEESSYVVLIYLNDDYEGGETVFYDSHYKESARIKPEKGKAVIFDIDVLHSGEKVITGEKYWIGCDLLTEMSDERKAMVETLKEVYGCKPKKA
jgi:hypothetical protein